MTDAELIRAVFDQLHATPETEQPELRRRIVRMLRGEVATRPEQCEECQSEGALMVATNLPEEIRLRIEHGGEMLRRRVDDETRERIERFEKLRKFVAELLPEDLLPYACRLVEQPHRHPDYFLELRLTGCAPIKLRLTYSQGRWAQVWWDEGGLYAVLPYEGCPVQFAEDESDLDCAIARAYEVGLHYPPPDDETPTEIRCRGWLGRLMQRILGWALT